MHLGLDPPRAGISVPAEDLESAVRGAWMVVEAVPEKLELEQAVFAELDKLAEPDAILASNSSSLAHQSNRFGVKRGSGFYEHPR